MLILLHKKICHGLFQKRANTIKEISNQGMFLTGKMG